MPKAATWPTEVGTPAPRGAVSYHRNLRMPTAEDVKARIEASIPGATAEVQSPDNVHFDARVVAEAFAGLSRIEQHRLVYAAFEGELGGAIHALQLKTETP